MIPLANILQPLIDAAEWVILLFHDDVGLSWGLSIVGLTFATRILILPLSVKQISSMRHLQQHAPELKVYPEDYDLSEIQAQEREISEMIELCMELPQ